MEILSVRQKEIAEASLALIAEKGIQGFTIKNLSRKIGVTEPAIYRHYENKFGILYTILDFFQKEFQDSLIKTLNSDAHAITKIKDIYSSRFNKFAENPSWVSVIFSEEIFKNEEKLSKKISSIIFQQEEVLIRIIKEGQAKNQIRDDADAIYLSTIILGSMRILVKKWELLKYAFDLRKEGEKLFTVLNVLFTNK
ncbi:MAG: TetR/AcrR family transcriptional regulator [Cyclobacteriaceae bacterium]|nr:TetR/AcrR family transcriptional regulator [Cyclobacteriaceae bacterium]